MTSHGVTIAGYLMLLFQLQQLYSVEWCKVIIIWRIWRNGKQSLVAYPKLMALNLSEATLENHEKHVKVVTDVARIHSASIAVSANVLVGRNCKTCRYFVSDLCLVCSEFQAGTICSGLTHGWCASFSTILCPEAVCTLFPFVFISSDTMFLFDATQSLGWQSYFMWLIPI